MSQAVKPVRGSTEQPDHIMLSIKGCLLYTSDAADE